MSILREIQRTWKKRNPSAHKAHFGKVLIIAGSKGLTGAAHLCAEACLRSGAGLTTLGVPETVYTVLARRCSAEVMVRAFPANSKGSFSKLSARGIERFSLTQDVVAIGPGLSQNPDTQAMIRSLLIKTQHQPLVIDADALNALKNHTEVLKSCRGRAILTPHAGEFSRLFKVTLSDDQKDRIAKAKTYSQKHQVIIVLKGRRTIVASPEGRVYINATGNPGMASGGTGDVLTGIIAALLGQGFSCWDAARFGVYAHGRAGDLAARKFGQVAMTASDIIDFLPVIYKKILGW